MRRQLLPPARRRIKVIVNDRITAYIQSLDAGNGPLLDSIEEEALADCVPIIRRETSAFLKTLIALKRPQSILEVGTAVGYSALLMSRVMPENCRITTIEKYEKEYRLPSAILKGQEKSRALLYWKAMRKRYWGRFPALMIYIYGCG